jgi:hypothetical protein
MPSDNLVGIPSTHISDTTEGSLRVDPTVGVLDIMMVRANRKKFTSEQLRLEAEKLRVSIDLMERAAKLIEKSAELEKANINEPGQRRQG